MVSAHRAYASAEGGFGQVAPNNCLELGADEKTLQKRKKELEKFLSKISTEKEKPKRRVRPKFEYNAVYLLRLPSPNGTKTLEMIESYVNA